MADAVEVRAIVRVEMLERVVHALRQAGVPRLTVTRIHAVGAGVDPAGVRLSIEEGVEIADKAQVQCIVAGDQCDRLIAILEGAAHTGRRGDGIVSIHPVLDVVKIRTGQHGIGALA